MKVLLTAINAKYIHTNLAIRYLRDFVVEHKDSIQLKEFTINQSVEYMLGEIYKIRPEILCISCYIWNINIAKEVVREYKKIDPQVRIVLGGPEVSYETKELMEEYPEIHGVIVGEGEETFLEMLDYYEKFKEIPHNCHGLYLRENDIIKVNPFRKAMDMDKVPFPYEDLSEFENRIIYYETTRGCPYNCQYCLSSIEKGVRFRSFQLVKKELQHFLDANVMQVKFVDRTFNASKEHAKNIWGYLMEHDNGYTNFHFEITADLLTDEIIEFLRSARPGLFQFEIGVQSTNEKTMGYIKRKISFIKLQDKVNKIKALGNIHQHLDLIAGLPGEDYESFGHSFDDVFALEPEQLQLGFLKVLKGSGLFRDQEKYGLVYRDEAPYEILKTKELSYGELLDLKMIEEMVETYYNSNRFLNSVQYVVGHYDSPFKFFEALASYWVSNGLHHVNHGKLAYYEHLYKFYIEQFDNGKEELLALMTFDIFYHEKAKKVTAEMEAQRIKDDELAIREFYKNEEWTEDYLPQLSSYNAKQKSRIAHIEVLPLNPFIWMEKKEIVDQKTAVLFNYHQKNPVTAKAEIYDVTELVFKEVEHDSQD